MTVQAITTTDAVKQLAGIADSNSDQILQALLGAVVSVFSSYTNHQLDEHSFTEYRNGSGSPVMSLANYPIVSISSVQVCGISIPPSNGTPNSYGFNYHAGSRVLTLCGKSFDYGNRNVTITGVAGYGNSIAWPNDLIFAANQWIVARYNERTRIGKGSQSMAGQSMSYVPDAANGSPSTGMPAAAKTILLNYMNYVPENQF